MLTQVHARSHPFFRSLVLPQQGHLNPQSTPITHHVTPTMELLPAKCSGIINGPRAPLGARSQCCPECYFTHPCEISVSHSAEHNWCPDVGFYTSLSSKKTQVFSKKLADSLTQAKYKMSILLGHM